MSIAKEFILAAERHKVVCEKLLAMPELLSLQQDEHLLANNSNEWSLLADIYYLTGYVIECSCCATIYSFYTNNLLPIDKKELKTTTIADDGNTYKVAFDKDALAIMFASNKDHFLTKSKGFQNFNAVFGNIAPANIPILGFNISNDLLKNWNANIRYKIEKEVQPNAQPSQKVLPITYESIKAFFIIAKDLYEKVVITFQP